MSRAEYQELTQRQGAFFSKRERKLGGVASNYGAVEGGAPREVVVASEVPRQSRSENLESFLPAERRTWRVNEHSIDSSRSKDNLSVILGPDGENLVAPQYGLGSERSGERLHHRFVNAPRDRINNTNLTAAAALLMGGSPAQSAAYSGATMVRNQSDVSMGEQYCILPTSTSNKGANRSILRKAAGGVVAPRPEQEVRARNSLNRQASQNRALN